MDQAVSVVRANAPVELDRVSAALPGSQSAAAATALAALLKGDLAGWALLADQQASRMRASAAAWSTTDDEVGRLLARLELR